jgi:predicted dehydrogenase
VDIGVHVLDYALFLLGNPGVVSVSASTYDLLGTNGFGGGGKTKKTGSSDIFDVEDLATVFMRLDDGATLLLEASWATHRADGDEFGVTLYGTRGGADLRVVDYAPRGELTYYGESAERLSVGVGDEHAGVVADFVATVRSGEWDGHDGAAAAELARVVDASYRSAAERREVSLSAPPSP